VRAGRSVDLTTVPHFRDDALGAALRSLDLPEHSPSFFAHLEARLATVERRRPRLRRRARRLAAAIVVAAAGAVAAVLLLKVFALQDSDVARAAAIRARVAAAVTGVQSARGELTYTFIDPFSGKRRTTRQSFVLDAAGDQFLVDLAAGARSAYDAARGVERAITTSAVAGVGGRFYAERVGLAPGPPDESAPSPLLDQQLGAVTRALAAADDPRVRAIEFHGRSAWVLDVAVKPNTLDTDIDHLAVTVDRTSAFPLHVLATLHGRFRSELRLDKLELDSSPAPGTFSVQFPPHAEVLRTDAGFVNVDLGQAGRLAGYQPLLPTHVPPRFRLVTVAVAKSAERTGPGQTNPPSRRVVSMSYRRGLEQITITTRLRGDGRWRDPFAVEGVPASGEQVHLDRGALAGSTAEVVVDPRVIPHLWAVSDRLVVTVAGDLSRDQLIAIAEALR
jgi:hypothetical protein